MKSGKKDFKCLIDNMSACTIDGEKTFIDNEWWYVENLIKASKDLEVFDLDLVSLDLGVMPWRLTSVFHFIGHSIDIKKCSLKYPVILAPAGWVMNGWHRIAKAILQGKKTIKAVRFFDLPEPDGIKQK